jgi:DNA-binding LytR/AlgR family response regulator
MILKCLLIKDKAVTSKQLTAFIEKTATLTLQATATDVAEAGRIMSKVLPDMVFLSLQQFQQLKNAGFAKEQPPIFICIDNSELAYSPVTLYPNLSVSSKQLSYEIFLDIINQAIVQLLGSLFSNNHKDENYLFIKSDYRIVKINYNDILFCEGLKDYTQIYTNKRSKPIITLQNLKTFSDRLPSKNFVRIHRSYIVSLNHIETISKKEVEIGEKIIPIGNSYRSNLLDIIRLNS